MFIINHTFEHEAIFNDYINSWPDLDPIIPSAISNLYYNQQLLTCRKSESEKSVNFVPATVYFYLNDTQTKLLGIIHFRHYLNDFLFKYGGHIGYSVHPLYRNNNIETNMLGYFLQFIKQIIYDEVLITCDADNIASERVILKNNGEFLGTINIQDKVIKRYLLTI